MTESISRHQFEAKWGPRPGYVSLPCRCDSEICEGWQWRSRRSIVEERTDGIEDLDIVRGYYAVEDVDAALARFA